MCGFKKISGADRLEIEVPRISKHLKTGGSLSVNGVCLTVIRKKGRRVFFNVVGETQRRSTLGRLKPGDPVNLERPLKAGGRLEGHLVLGHVDATGKVLEVLSKGREKSFCISFPKNLRRYFVEKGSVAVDGVSLTLGRIRPGSFWVHMIPHTLSCTSSRWYQKNTRVNLEADILLKSAVRRFKGLTSPRAHYKL